MSPAVHLQAGIFRAQAPACSQKKKKKKQQKWGILARPIRQWLRATAFLPSWFPRAARSTRGLPALADDCMLLSLQSCPLIPPRSLPTKSPAPPRSDDSWICRVPLPPLRRARTCLSCVSQCLPAARGSASNAAGTRVWSVAPAILGDAIEAGLLGGPPEQRTSRPRQVKM